MGAAMRGHIETAQSLLKFSADINIKSNNGKTALKWASEMGQMEVVKLLQKMVPKNDNYSNQSP
jgi:ankyrin repeat protein